MWRSNHIVVVGGGIFGLAAALELEARGYRLTLVDPGPLPHPLAASTDISKVIRMEYGPDEAYMALMEEARLGWLAWNGEWTAEGVGPLYHETGVVMVCRDLMSPGGFEYESWRMLLERGHTPERLDAEELVRRFPAWSSRQYVDGFYHAQGGYAESGRVVEALARRAIRVGIDLRSGWRAASLLEDRSRIRGVRDSANSEIRADGVVVAAGSWTAKLIPELGDSIRVSGHPVFHLRPQRPELFRADHFPVFTADVARTGFYGFPLHRDGVVKIANHGLGVPLDPDGPRVVGDAEESRLRAFLPSAFPALLDAPVTYRRLCPYADTQDEDFWIARHPGLEGLTVASGGSGHGFKFAPLLGSLIADAVEGKANPRLAKFRWRPEVRLRQGREAARCHIEDGEL